MCGSRVVVDLAFGVDGRVIACGIEVRACALGQASATLLAQAIIGRDPASIIAASAALAAFLSGMAETPGDWPGLEALIPARDYPGRHPSIRLPFEAAAEAAQRLRAAA